MKKVISLLLAIAVFCSFGISAVSADEVKLSRHDELMKLAREVFPEYADFINDEAPVTDVVPYSDSMDSDVVFSETRKVSETQSLNITRLARGQTIITSVEGSGPEILVPDSSISGVGPDTIGRATFEVICTSLPGVFVYSSVRFIIHANGSGYFTSYGTPSGRDGIDYGKINESSTGISYEMTFNPAGAKKFVASFHLTIFGGSLHATVR